MPWEENVENRWYKAQKFERKISMLLPADFHYSLDKYDSFKLESRLLLFNPPFLPPYASYYWTLLCDIL